MEEEKGMMGKQEKEKMLLQAAYDGNLRLLRSLVRFECKRPRSPAPSGKPTTRGKNPCADKNRIRFGPGRWESRPITPQTLGILIHHPDRWKSTTLHPRGAGAVSPRRASVPPAPLSSSRRAPAPPTASTGDGASHRILLRRCLPPHPPASPPPLGSRCRHRRRLTSDLPEQPLVDASAAATDFPGAAFLPPSADIRDLNATTVAASGEG
uniref:Uncharacterized protein n=1 Tax=Oryza nivara TaxID=4536 RepID=A0A0E0I8X3_ORYNI